MNFQDTTEQQEEKLANSGANLAEHYQGIL